MADEEYDLVLVVEYCRSTPYYLSIIRYLAATYRVAIYPIALDNELLAKNRDAQENFIQDCVALGADCLSDPPRPVYTKVLLVPQRPYQPGTLDPIKRRVHARHSIAALTLAWPGLHEEFMTSLGIKKVFVVDRAFSEFLVARRGNGGFYNGCEVVEVGLPYEAYPFAPDFEADYMLAMPTLFSFPHERDKWAFLETVLKLFNDIGEQASIVHKPHNGETADAFASRVLLRIAKAIRSVPGMRGILFALIPLLRGSLRTQAERLYTALLYSKVLDRVTSLRSLTSSSALGLEVFLPGVRCGVIGGLSNTIWAALFYRLPFYNCVDLEQQNRQADGKLYSGKNAGQLLELNLQYFGVPYCNGELVFDERLFSIVKESTRQADLLEALRSEIDRCHREEAVALGTGTDSR